MTTRAVWFRRDLRLNDHTALAKALEHTKKGDEIVCVFHIDPALNETFTPNHDYFFQTLATLVEDAEQKGAPIHFIEGDIETAFQNLIEQLDVNMVYFNRDETGYGKKRDQQLLPFLNSINVEVYHYIDHHLHGSGEVRKQDGNHYKVFTPYYRKWKQIQKPTVEKVDHELLSKVSINERMSFSQGIKAFDDLVNHTERVFEGVGEKEALQQLEHFLEEDIYDYDERRDYPAVDGTSLMSRYLRTGAISIRTIYHQIEDRIDHRRKTTGVDTYVSELAWRDFYNMIYHFYPNAGNEEMVQKYQGIPWNNDEDIFRKWQEGQTGFPLIDAAMRQLNATGWMHNRLRMAVASFLTKDLLIDWRKGERYFKNRLIDYDPASNIGGWQWAASTGTDPVPYFRVFNPTRQSERFDPHGRFIKGWLPELENVKKKHIHDPSRMSIEDQEEANCIIGEDYPAPMVDHKRMRERAIELFKDKT